MRVEVLSTLDDLFHLDRHGEAGCLAELTEWATVNFDDESRRRGVRCVEGIEFRHRSFPDRGLGEQLLGFVECTSIE